MKLTKWPATLYQDVCDLKGGDVFYCSGPFVKVMYEKGKKHRGVHLETGAIIEFSGTESVQIFPDANLEFNPHWLQR